MTTKRSPIPGPNILNVGESGTGKTYALKTFLDEGLETFVLFTEPGMEVISEHTCEEGLHFKYIPPASPEWEDMIDSSNKINKMSYKALATLESINKQKYAQFIDVLTSCNNFTCDRCGKSFGDVSTWGTDRVFAIDSLSGLNIMAMNLVVGSKPTKAMSDWMTAMDNLERLLQKLCTDTRCTFALTAHLEREQDEITGAVQLMASTLGRKLAPKIPRFFSDVVMSVREGSDFSWATDTMNVALKARNLPIRKGIVPSYAAVMENWKKNGGIIEDAKE